MMAYPHAGSRPGGGHCRLQIHCFLGTVEDGAEFFAGESFFSDKFPCDQVELLAPTAQDVFHPVIKPVDNLPRFLGDQLRSAFAVIAVLRSGRLQVPA